MQKFAQLPINLKESFTNLLEGSLGVSKKDGNLKITSNGSGVSFRVDTSHLGDEEEETLKKFYRVHMYQWMLACTSHAAYLNKVIPHQKKLNEELQTELNLLIEENKILTVNLEDTTAKEIELDATNSNLVYRNQKLIAEQSELKAEIEYYKNIVEDVKDYIKLWSGKRGKALKAIINKENVEI